MAEQTTELTSWKAIAAYLGVNLRTAQRWEQERELPVKRFSGKTSRVVARTSELDRWKATHVTKRTLRADLQILRVWAVASTCAVLVGLLWILAERLFAPQPGPPSYLEWSGRELVASDSAGRRLWIHRFPEPPRNHEAELQRWFGHLQNGSKFDTLFVNAPMSLATVELLCLDENGQIRWKFLPGRLVADSKRKYPPVYAINQFLVFEAAPNQSRIVVSSSHAWSYPDQVAVLDSDGKMVGEYWHAGHLTTIAKARLDNNSSADILLGGVDKGRQMATLVVLDPGNVRGASAEDSEDSCQLRGFPAGTEKAIVWFDRTAVNQISEDHNYVSEVNVMPDGIGLKVQETPDGRAFLVYMLDRNLNVISVEPSEGFRSIHRELERAGKIRHPFDESELALNRHVHVFRQKN